MKKSTKIKRAVNNFLFDHQALKISLESAWSLIVAVACAAIFAFGFVCFITPADPVNGFTIITGGVSGLSQNIAIIVRIIFHEEPANNLIQSLGYFVINIPLVIFAYFTISKKFAIFSLVNVGITSLFISWFSASGWAQEIANSTILDNNTLTRVLIAAICTGASSALSFKGDISCGGMDIISYYIGMKKSTTVGKYTIIINIFIISLFSFLKLIENPSRWEVSVYSILYSSIYLFICGLVVDSIHLRNKKIQLQIITSSDKMSDILLAYFPHGATVARATGAYTHTDRNVIWMVVSNAEVKKVIRVAKRVDPHVFISSIPLSQVYGNFFNKPIA